MSEIHFTAADLSRVTVASTMGPVAETVFALGLFGRPGNVLFDGWRRQVDQALGPRRAAVRAVTRAVRPVPDLLWLLARRSQTDDDRLASVGLNRSQITTTVREFCQLAVLPYWGRIRRHLEAEQGALARILAGGGVERLLRVVHQRARWEAPVLSLPVGAPQEIRLDGRGLVITPSFFLRGDSCVVVDPDQPSGRYRVVCPMPPKWANTAALWHGPDRIEDTLSALIGRTRASMLAALTESRSTGELAQRLGVSSAAASQHTAVLRQAGLITTRRNHARVLHTITTLGTALLDRGTARLDDEAFAS